MNSRFLVQATAEALSARRFGTARRAPCNNGTNVGKAWSGAMLRVFLTVLGLGLMAAPAGLAASPRSADWMIPRPVTTPSSDRPARVIDVASVRYKWYELHRASLLNDGRLLLWESGRSMDDPGDWSISLLDAISGAIDTLWHCESNIGGKPILSADRNVAWFAAHVSPVTLSGVRDGLFVIDLQGRQIWPLDRVYDDATLIEEALNKGYWKARAEPDGRLLIQFADLAAAEMWGKPRAKWTVAPPERDVFPYAYLPSPQALFGQAGSGRRVSPTFGVSDRALLKFDDARDPRPEPRAVGSERYWREPTTASITATMTCRPCGSRPRRNCRCSCSIAGSILRRCCPADPATS